MMEFGPRISAGPRPTREGNIVPMINVVFLLLIFFLMTAELAPPEPFPVTPPEADADPAGQSGNVLSLGADGQLAYGAARGEAVFAALARRADTGPLPIRADAALPARDLVTLLRRLSEAGLDEIVLLTAPEATAP